LLYIGRLSDKDKQLEIMVLRYQPGIAERKMKKPVRANRAERMTWAVLAGNGIWFERMMKDLIDGLYSVL